MSRVLLALSGLSALGASALLAWRVGSAPAQSAVTPPAVYAPAPPVVKAGEVYERETPATGFILLVEATPEAEVTIDGKSSGETPVSLNFECQPGQKLELKLQREGYRPLERTVACKKDVMVVLKTRLEARRQ